METHVYANGREVCSQAADGKSAAASPDVCWSPPGPPAGPVPIPYPNTTFAKDLADGTRTILVCGTMVAQKDKSHFSTSTGNEPATNSFAKGLNTGVLKGKAYFTSWSMNVMVEGLNVARHQDSMTHNHASPGGNTPPQVYFDGSTSMPGGCKEEQKRIEKECGPESEPPGDKTQGLRRTRKTFLKKVSARLEKLSAPVKGKLTGDKKTGSNAWMEHCDGLWIKPHTRYSEQLKQFAAQIGNIKADMGSVIASAIKPLVEKLTQEILEKVGKEAAERLAKLGARAGGRWLLGTSGAAAGGVGAVVTEIIATGWNIYDGATTLYEGYQLSKQATAAIGQIKEVMGDFDKALKDLDAVWNDVKRNPQKAMAEGMGILSRLNPCTRARRCLLVPYNQTRTAVSLAGKGCCPGQTGHHVLPHEMTKDGKCPGYTHGSAPTVCVEGVNNSHGSHGRVHDTLAREMEDYKTGGFSLFGPRETISYAKARDIAIDSVRDTFPESKCSKDCLRAQLDSYYKNKCKGTLSPVAGKKKSQKEGDADAFD